MTRAALIVLSTLLAACGTPDGEATAEAAYTIGPEGAGNLTGETPFTLPAIERAFSGLDVVAVSVTGTPVFEVREPGRSAALYVVTPDWTRGYAGAVGTASPDVAGPKNLRAGMSRLSDVPTPLKASCAEPSAAGAITLVCDSPGFRLEFSGTGADPLLARQTYLPPLP